MDPGAWIIGTGSCLMFAGSCRTSVSSPSNCERKVSKKGITAMEITKTQSRSNLARRGEYQATENAQVPSIIATKGVNGASKYTAAKATATKTTAARRP